MITQVLAVVRGQDQECVAKPARGFELLDQCAHETVDVGDLGVVEVAQNRHLGGGQAPSIEIETGRGHPTQLGGRGALRPRSQKARSVGLGWVVGLVGFGEVQEEKERALGIDFVEELLRAGQVGMALRRDVRAAPPGRRECVEPPGQPRRLADQGIGGDPGRVIAVVSEDFG